MGLCTRSLVSHYLKYSGDIKGIVLWMVARTKISCGFRDEAVSEDDSWNLENTWANQTLTHAAELWEAMFSDF